MFPYGGGSIITESLITLKANPIRGQVFAMVGMVIFRGGRCPRGQTSGDISMSRARHYRLIVQMQSAAAAAASAAGERGGVALLAPQPNYPDTISTTK